jgi:hypothetical protein
MCVPGDCRTRQAARPASVPAHCVPLGCAGYRGQMQSLVGLSGVEPVSPGPCPVFSLNYKPKLGW